MKQVETSILILKLLDSIEVEVKVEYWSTVNIAERVPSRCASNMGGIFVSWKNVAVTEM